MREAVIVEAVRTPIGKKNGTLSGMRTEDLAAFALKKLVKKAGIPAEAVEDVIFGCVTQSGEQAFDIARVAALTAGFPIEVPGVTIDRQCGSSQQAVHFASQVIISGDADVIIAGGIESMSRQPIGAARGNVSYNKQLTSQHELLHQGVAGQRIAEKWGFTREDMDKFSYESHQKAIKAIKEGKFNAEIVPIDTSLEDGTRVILTQDECPREDTSLEKLSKLKPAFSEDGTITAGNSSQICDGASAILIMSKEKALELGLKPRFLIHTRAVVGSDPTLMLTGPIPATEKVLKKAGLTIDDIDVFEVNEAFASIPMAWLAETKADPNKLNPNGGAIALGHPLGASGTRLMITMMHELERTGGRYGLQTICEGFGMANATILERLD